MTSLKGEVSIETPIAAPAKQTTAAAGLCCVTSLPRNMAAVNLHATSHQTSQSVNIKTTSAAKDDAASVKSTASSSSSSAEAPSAARKGPNDFIFGKMIGEGSFSTVYIAKEVHTNLEYAIKVCDKRHILKEKKQAYIKQEKEVLNILNTNPTPFFVKLYCTFQDPERLYFVLTYAKNGELLPYINKVGSFDIQCSRFYAAEVLLALQHLHRLGIIHRDLKPENILLNEHMHILITDFGSAKILSKESTEVSSSGTVRSNSFVGTAQYVSPELLTDKSACKSSDLWALGCILYQMVSGLPPFRAPNEYLIFQRIIKLEYEFPDGFHEEARGLVEKLLVLDPTERLGAKDHEGYPSIRAHHFFDGVRWDTLDKEDPPTIYPYLPGTSDNEELRSNYKVPDSLQPGLNDKQMTRLLGLDLRDEEGSKPAPPAGEEKPVPDTPVRVARTKKVSVIELGGEDRDQRLALQARENSWHKFVENNLIIRQGLVDKRKGLFSRRRMLLLTTGPHLYYVDPVNLVLKGEIPWSPELRPEPKNFKTFFVHTPNRTYYLEDPEGYALEWCRVIDEVRVFTYQQLS